MTEPHHLFISYARQDGRQYAERLDYELRAAGYNTWRDTRDIPSEKDFTASIEKAIEDSSHVLVCVTPASKRDDCFVRREIMYALLSQKPVIVLRFTDIKPHIQIITFEWIDLFQGWEAGFDRLLKVLQNRTEDSSPAPSAIPSSDPFRPYLETSYQRIVKFLTQATIQQLELIAENTPEAVITPRPQQDMFDQLFCAEGMANNGSSIFHNVEDAFAQHHGRILLLGQPGAGKTITLMSFARDAITARLNDQNAPLPLFGLISTWDAKKSPPLSEWLASNYPELNPLQVNNLLSEGRVLLLLDGLDELGREEENPEQRDNLQLALTDDPRKRFIEMIPTNNQVIITCRIKDYNEIGQKMALEGAITLQPLKDEQIHTYLRDIPDLLALLESDIGLREVARIPLLLNLFTIAFRELPEEAAKLRHLQQGDLRDHIFKTYVTQQYQREKRKRHTQVSFSLDEIYAVLGQTALDNARHWELPTNVLPERDFNRQPVRGRGDAFIELVTRLNLIVSQAGKFRFVHVLLRDYFAYNYAAQTINDNRWGQRNNAAQGLGRLGDERGIALLIPLLHDENPYVRSAAVSALGETGDKRALNPLIAALQDPDSWVVQLAFNALSQFESYSTDLLVAHLEDKNRDTRRNAAAALGRLNDQQVITALMKALHDSDVGVRRNAARSLGKLRAVEAVEALIALLDDPTFEPPTYFYYRSRLSWRVCDSAAEALEAIATPEALTAVKAWRQQML